MTQSVCAAPASTNLYAGGSNDGFSFNAYTQPVCSPLTSSNIYSGNTSDGFSRVSLTQIACPPLVITNIYGGGFYDGYSGRSVCNGCASASCTAALPVELLLLTAKWNDNTYSAALLQWTTDMETNNDYFIVEKTALTSSNGEDMI